VIEHWIAEYGYAAIYCLLMLGIVGLPVPDETLLAVTGHLVQTGRLHLVPAFLSAFAGTTTGITISFLIGRTGGLRLVHRYGPKFGITAERLEQTHQFFLHRGHWSLTIGYFIPGVRHFVAVFAGTARLEWPVFTLFAYSGALVWVVIFQALGYYLSEEWERVAGGVHKWMELAAVVAAVLLLAAWLIRRRGWRLR
jgi:membrane protein DedA with SNARE-associated domain